MLLFRFELHVLSTMVAKRLLCRLFSTHLYSFMGPQRINFFFFTVKQFVYGVRRVWCHLSDDVQFSLCSHN